MSRIIFSRTRFLISNCKPFLNSSSTRHVASTSFKVQDPEDFSERVLKSEKPIIVDFFATWCNPCKLLAPRIESIVDEKKGKVLLAKIDIDQNSDIALDYEVQAVPVLLTFKDGKPGERIIGLQDEDKLRAFVNRFIGE